MLSYATRGQKWGSPLCIERLQTLPQGEVLTLFSPPKGRRCTARVLLVNTTTT